MHKPNRPVIILAEDQEEFYRGFRDLADNATLEPVITANLGEAVTEINKHSSSGDLCGVVTDLKFEGGAEHGWSIICHVLRISSSVPIALWTAWSSDPVQEVFRTGAALPPFQLFPKTRSGGQALGQWMADIRASWDDSLAITLKDANTSRIYREIAPIYARSDLPILIVGESGTGKESLAATVHETSRRRGPFRPINCGGLEPSLAFAEIFGHTAGSYSDAIFHELGIVLEASGYKPGPRPAPGRPETRTFVNWLTAGNPDLQEKDGLLESQTAQDNAGTLFLDEIATLPPKVMAGVLRILSPGDVRPFGYHGPALRSYCRIVTATNEVDVLRSSVKDKVNENVEFRRDLYYRLAGAVLTLPPLRDRDAADIEHVVEKSVWRAIKLPRKPVEKAALEYIVALYKGTEKDKFARQYQLGNFRPLRHLIYRSALIAEAESAGQITLAHVRLAIQHGELRVEDEPTATQERHIRDVFRAALKEKGVEIEAGFARKALTQLTRTQSLPVGFAFLTCASSARLRPNPKLTHYTLREIEAALTSGGTAGCWYGKCLTKELVSKAAVECFPEFKCQSQNHPATEISDIVTAIQNLTRCQE